MWDQQTLPITFFFSRSEKCIVGTGLERQVALDSGVPAIAEHEGKIIYMDIDKIILSGNGYTVSIPLVISTFQQKYLYTSKNSGLARKMH
jgi:DNA-directed RNA polymerase subunit beta